MSGYFAESPAVHSIDVKNIQIEIKKTEKRDNNKKNFSKRNKKRYLFLV